MTQRDLSPIWIALVDLFLLVLNVVIVQVAPVHATSSGVEEKAEYLITIEWPVDIDADADVHLMPPSKHPVFYGARQVGCARLDQDNKGLQDAIVKLDDGSTAKLESDKETIQLRCIEPGHYDAAVNLYAFRVDNLNQADRNDLGLKVHCEIVAINPAVHLVFARDVTLDPVGQTINWASFDLDRAGAIRLTDPPLAAVTESYTTKAPAP
jgi:hypothetical protein